ncbi:MAG: cytochrome c oxidase assembly protein [Polyangiaceae bacterium]|jgi:cytochrome c oxidase assembly factor CtaG
MTTRGLLLSAWDPGLPVSLACIIALGVYGVRFRRHLEARAVFFGLAVATFFGALASPVGVLARGYLFSAHMLQHLLLLLAAPPLVLLGLPRKRGAPATPPRHRGPFGYLGPWAAGVGAMWLWHAPALCNLAAVSPTVQTLQIASLLGLGLAFWRPVLAPCLADRFPPFSAILYLFAACVACTILGILVTFSPVEVCSAYVHPVDSLGILPLLRDGWGLSCRADQEIGGLMMWVPACLVYACAILATLGRYYGEERPLPKAVESAS